MLNHDNILCYRVDHQRNFLFVNVKNRPNPSIEISLTLMDD